MDAELPSSTRAAAPDLAGSPRPRHRPNYVVWVAIGVPAFAVIAGILLVFLSLRGAEPELPANYSWEGAALDQDLERARRAEELGAMIGLEFGADGNLVARLGFRDATQVLPTRLVVQLAHATLPQLDRRFEMPLDDASGTYIARLPPLQRGRWLIEIADGDGNAWRLRKRFLAPAAQVGLGL
ncbi:MAG: FixH family protein [Sinobacteraceae bacterium]|nr:FixH family protein [Nevskiaceae bacterium]